MSRREAIKHVPHPRVTARWAREELEEIWGETLDDAREVWSETLPEESGLEYERRWLQALWRYLR